MSPQRARGALVPRLREDRRVRALVVGLLVVALLRLGPAWLGPVEPADAVGLTFVVNSTGDGTDASPGDGTCDTGGTNSEGDDECTLRAAIEEVVGNDTVAFAVPASDGGHTGGVWTITPATALPSLSDDGLTLDGTTQPGWTSAPVVELDGGGVGFDGLVVTADDVIVRGLAVGGFDDGIVVQSADRASIVGNHVGVRPDGTTGNGNGDDGIEVAGTSTDTTIGGAVAADRNVVSDNGFGIYLGDAAVTGTTIAGNRVGTTADGLGDLGNGSIGIFDGDSTDTVIGGTSAGAGNLSSGNGDHGVLVGSSDTTLVRGNVLGLAADGSLLGNDGAGAKVFGTGEAAILGNSVAGNGLLGIELDPDGVLANDAEDGDSGPNDNLNHPVPATPTDGWTTLDVDLDVPAGDYRVEVFTNATDGADASGFGEGETLVHAETVTVAGVAGAERFTLTGIPAWTAGDVVTATATEDLGSGAYGATSEFSPAVEATSPSVVLDRIQKGSTTIANGATTRTVTIDAVDTSASFLTFSLRGDDADPQDMWVSGELTDSTTVTFERWTTGGELAIEWSVVAFTAGVSVQRGVVTSPTTTTDVTISAVDTSTSFPLLSHRIDGGTFGDNDFLSATLTSATNLRIGIANASINVVPWQVVTYDDAVVQSGSVSFGTSDLTRTATVTAVDTGRAWLHHSYTSASGTGSDIGQKLVRGQVTDATTLTFDRSNSGQAITVQWQLVEFTDATQVQHGSASLGTGVLSSDVAITDVLPGRSIATAGYLGWGGRSSYAADDNPGVAWFTSALTSGTNLRLGRATAPAAADAGWSVVHWPCQDSDDDGLCDDEEDANTDADGDPSTNPGPDTDGDGTPNHLDADDDGDGTPTRAENADRNGDGDPRDARDGDHDGQPDHLDVPRDVTDGTVVDEQKISDTAGGLTATFSGADQFGRALASIGDLDGDGVVDVAVGAPYDSTDGTNRGAVHVLFLDADGTVRDEQRISHGTGGLTTPLADGSLFGHAVAGIGDVDGDGIGDLAVGTPGIADGGADRGGLFVLFLDTDGTVRDEQKISDTVGGLDTTLANGDLFGRAATELGDVDGDGIGDLAVGAPHADDGGTQRGAVVVLLLAEDGTVRAEQRISDTDGGLATTLTDADRFGLDLAGVGDVDGDGTPDLVVAAPYGDDGGSERGEVYVLLLDPDGTVASEQKISQSAGGGPGLGDTDLFGLGVEGVGDLDGDGTPDLVVGAAQDDDGGTDRGAFWVLFLDATGAATSVAKVSDTSGGFATTLGDGDRFGGAIASLGDLDTDGGPDLLVGAHLDDDGGSDRGAVYVVDLQRADTVVVNATGDASDAAAGDGSCDTGGTNTEGRPACTLRAAIEEANADPSLARVAFDLPVTEPGHDSGVWTITPASSYPDVTASIDLDATTQPGWTADPVVVLDGSGYVPVGDGSDDGLDLRGAGSWIAGLSVVGWADEGIHVADSGITLTGSWIGLAPDGTALANDVGVQVGAAGTGATIGGTTTADRNVVSGNASDGIQVRADDTTIAGNRIGTDATGTLARPNGGDGILLLGTASDNVVGGTDPGDANVLAHNAGSGLAVGSAGATDNAVLGNVVRANGALGIDLRGGTEDGAGVTANDAEDADSGPNDLLNHPVLSAPDEGATTLEVDLDVPAGDHRVEVFANPTEGADPSGHGEGETLVHAETVTATGAVGSESFTLTGLPAVSAGDVLTATLTEDLGGGLHGSTSELSAAVTTGVLLRGTVYEDVDGDGDLVDDGVGVGDVEVRVLRDDGDGEPDAGDVLVAATTTAVDGTWGLAVGSTGTHWVAVDAGDVVPSDGLETGATLDDVRAEQTYAVAGAARLTGGGWTFTAGPGAFAGGARLGATDGFPDLGHAEHVLRVVVAASDVTGLDVGFSFAVVAQAGDELAPPTFDDAGAWTTFDLATIDGDLEGFEGGVFDGRHHYLAPDTNDTGLHGNVVRYDTAGAVDAPASWASFDLATIDAGAAGYAQAAFDGRHVYLVPEHDASGAHGRVFRHDTTGDFTNASSWELFDTATLAGGPVRFNGAFFDGRYLVMAPGSDDDSDLAVRYDTTASFTDASSWETHDLLAAGVYGAGDDISFVHGATDGRFGYWTQASGTTGLVLRYDGRATSFSDAWTHFDVVGDGPAMAVGWSGAAFDGRYLHLAPNIGHGEALRYDTTASFDAAGSWSVVDLATFDATYVSFDGAAFDGRNVWFVPTRDVGGALSLVRHDTTLPHADAGSWSSFDLSTLVAATDTFDGVLFDGRSLLLVPDGNGDRSGVVAQLDLGRVNQGSLRQLLDNSNAITGTQSGTFALDADDPRHVTGGAVDHWPVPLQSPLPAVADALTLDATAQAGWTSGQPVVGVDATALGGTDDGFQVTADDVDLAGLAIWGAPRNGVRVDGDRATLRSSWLGRTPDGAVVEHASPSTDLAHVRLAGADAVVGGALDADGNVLTSGSGEGVFVASSASGTSVRHNHVGVAGDGTTPLGTASAYGLLVTGSSTDTQVRDNQFGNLASGAIQVRNSPTGVVIAGNVFGTDALGTAVLPVEEALVVLDAGDVVFGGVAAADGNTVRNVTDEAVAMSAGATGTVAVLGNDIVGSGGLAIDLAEDGVTPNDAGDGDPGANGLLNHPVVSSVTGVAGGVEVAFDLDVPAGAYRVEAFANPSGADPSGHGEAEVPLGGATITHTGSGSEAFTTTFTGGAGDGQDVDAVSLTATEDLGGGTWGATSELSAAVDGVVFLGDRVIRDSTGNGHDGVAAGAMTTADQVAGRVGGALDLDGSDDRVEVANLDVAGQALTTSGWFHVDDFRDGANIETRVIAKAASTNNATYQWVLRLDDASPTAGNVEGFVRTGSTLDARDPDAIGTGTWVHAATVYDGSDIRLYVDGVLKDSTAQSGDLVVDPGVATWIGGQPASTERQLDGRVDEVRVSRTARSAGWVATEHANQSDPGSFVTVGAEQTAASPGWTVDTTRARGGSRSLRAPSDVLRSWLTADGLDLAGAELTGWWWVSDPAVAGGLDLAAGVRTGDAGALAVGSTVPIEQDETSLVGAAGLDLGQLVGGVRSQLAAPPGGQSPAGAAWQEVTVRIDQAGELDVLVDEVATVPASGTASGGGRASGSVGLRVGSLPDGEDWWVDDLRARRFVRPEPTTRLGPTELVP